MFEQLVHIFALGEVLKQLTSTLIDIVAGAFELMIEMPPELKAVALNTATEGLVPLVGTFREPAHQEVFECTRRVPSVDA